MFHTVDRCRICGNDRLQPILELGQQELTGVFPKDTDHAPTRGPLELVKCDGTTEDVCGLVQLKHSYETSEMYGENYGYRSSLNRSMARHLEEVVAGLCELVTLREDDTVLDIGSNDGTTLSFYPDRGPLRVGIDPTAKKFAHYYKPGIEIVDDLFTADMYRKCAGDCKAKIVTSIAMCYDLDDPMAFFKDVRDILAPDGVWLLEQSYLPSMLEANAYDTICHEHIEYYALKQIRYMADRLELKIIDLAVNAVNGGSFAVTLAHRESALEPSDETRARIVELERKEAALDDPATYEAFASTVSAHRIALRKLLKQLKDEGHTVLGYGASTKGNVMLQYCGITTELLPAIAEVNEEKFGCFTPGTRIPIVSEAEARELQPDYYLVLPWHFKTNLLQREAAFLEAGGKMIFPLPRIQIESK